MKKRFLLSIICCLVIQIPNFAAPDIPQNIIPQAGSINAHDLQNLERQTIEKQVEKDFQNYEKRKNDGKIKPEKERKQKVQIQK